MIFFRPEFPVFGSEPVTFWLVVTLFEPDDLFCLTTAAYLSRVKRWASSLLNLGQILIVTDLSLTYLSTLVCLRVKPYPVFRASMSSFILSTPE